MAVMTWKRLGLGSQRACSSGAVMCKAEHRARARVWGVLCSAAPRGWDLCGPLSTRKGVTGMVLPWEELVLKG